MILYAQRFVVAVLFVCLFVCLFFVLFFVVFLWAFGSLFLGVFSFDRFFVLFVV